MKKRIRYVLLILFLIFIITGNIDYHFRVKHNKAPLFTIKIKDKYYGFAILLINVVMIIKWHLFFIEMSVFNHLICM